YAQNPLLGLAGVKECKRLLTTTVGKQQTPRKGAGQLLQLCVLRFGFLQDGDIGVGVFPEGDNCLSEARGRSSGKRSRESSLPEGSKSRCRRARQAYLFSLSGVSPVGLNEDAYTLCRHGFRKQVSLGRPATGRRQQFALVSCFHPFCDHFKV